MAENVETSHDDACKEGAHYWVLDNDSFGICKKCGARKQFPVAVLFSWQNRKIVTGKTPHSPAD